MHRRDVLGFLGAAVLTPLLAPLSARERWSIGAGLHQRLGQAARALTPAQMALVSALSDTILPKTDTPGAVEVKVPEFLDLLVAEWYGDADKAELLGGLHAFDERCRAATGKAFAELDGSARETFLSTIDGKDGEKGSVEAVYRRLKDTIIFGYVTAEPVAKILATTPIIPGRFDGCTPVGSIR